MDRKYFNNLWELNIGPPNQQIQEWYFFLEFIEAYFKNRKIMNPIVVEIGIGNNKQKKYYEKLLGAEHIGIDKRLDRRADIVGDTGNLTTLNCLKTMLEGRPINLLFIDGGHKYESVKNDYKLYSPLTKNIIAFHDIRCLLSNVEVRLFWPEVCIIEAGSTKIEFYIKRKGPDMGIGLLIREDQKELY